MGSGRGLVLGLTKVLSGVEQGRMAGQDRARTLAQQAEDRARQARLDALQEQLLGGQLSDAATQRRMKAARDARLAAAADRIRQDPQFKAIADLPDEELVRTAAALQLQRAKPRPFGTTGAGAIDRHLRTVNTQIDDTARDLSAARRGVPKRPALGFDTPGAEQGFVRDSTVAAQRVSGLEQRADSLGRVRDRLAAALPDQPSGGGPAARRRITADQRDFLMATGRWDPTKYEVVP